MDFFTRATDTWFRESFDGPTPVQRLGWERIRTGEHALLLAPTGSGKTLAAFLWAIDRLSRLPPDAPPGVRVLYVSPLKALVYDVERNLRAPLVGVRRAAERIGDAVALRSVRVDVRTGDTPQRERQRQRRDPAEILVTTPESLFLILGSAARATLATVDTIIVDEVHALAPQKRGVHLALSLERVVEITAREPQRIGLSATVHPVDEVARFLGGEREVTVVDASERPLLDLTVTVPVPDMEDAHARSTVYSSADPAADPGADPSVVSSSMASAGRGVGSRDEPNVETVRGGPILAELYRTGVEPSERRFGIWPVVYPEILRQITENRSTIVFVNSRGLCERLAQKLNELAGDEVVLAHHGSVSHEKRRDIEEALKAGRVKGIVATSSLELGIDMGAVDLVVLVESPGSVARGLQRVGRAGHRVGETSRGVVFPKFRGDLLECAAIARRMQEGALEALRVPTNALDVLAQQLVAIACDADRSVADLERFVRRAYPYRDLSKNALVAVLDMLSGRYPSEDFADLRPRLVWDRAQDVLKARRGSAMVSRLNAGTIPDRGQFTVHVAPDGPRVGELDEEMVYESRTGDVILLGATSWRVTDITRDRVLVEPAPGESGRLPFWHGDGLGRPAELGRAVGALVRELGAMSEPDGARWLREHTPLDDYAAKNLAAYVAEQREHTGTLPTDRCVTIERFRDELGDWRVCILTPFGARIHAPWSMALQTALGARRGFEVVTMYGDDGLVLTFAADGRADSDIDGDGDLPDVDALLPEPEELEDLVTQQLAGSALFGANFRENAARALLLTRRSPRARSPLWAQRLKAKNLMAAVMRYPDFPIVLETYRHCLKDVFDLDGLADLLRRVRRREVRVDHVETRSASPFARSLVFAYVAAYLYEHDAPLAERRTHALSLDRNLLRELLGEAELRELLDAAVLEQVENELQHLAEDRRARDADELHDVLRRLGALSEKELARRAVDAPGPWLELLRVERRAVSMRIGGVERFVAAQDAGLYRDALGAVPPPGLPDAFLETRPRALETLVRRHARTHGPFTTREIAAALALQPAQVEPALRELERAGELVRGAIRPGGAELEWCGDDVLKRLKRQTLARLRGEIAPVEAGALARFLPAWHGLEPIPVDGSRRAGIARTRGSGAPRLEEVVAQLEGCALPWSTLSQVLLPARVPGFAPEMLDMLCASGRVVWVGRAPLGSGDGRVALYRRESARLLLDVPEPSGGEGNGGGDGSREGGRDGGRDGGDAEPCDPRASGTPLHAAILDHLNTRGASFTTALERAARAAVPEVTATELEAAMWDLVWAGQITNDTFAPLRSLGRSKTARRRSGRGRGGGAGAGMIGRWSLVAELGDEPGANAGSATERAHARAAMLLDRYGVVGREVAQAEELPGGFSAVYGVLKAMEEAGRIRRGFFVEGLGGAQFALAGAVDRLRDARETATEPVIHVLAAVDPANPWGAVLPWPETTKEGDPRPRRVPGAAIVLVDGEPALWVSGNRRGLVTFARCADEPTLALALAALAWLPGHRRALIVERIDGVAARRSGLRPLLEANGFVDDHRGYVLPRGVTPGA